MVLSLILCLILVLLILLIFRLVSNEKSIKLKNVESLKSGDLVLVKYDNLLGKAVKLWSGSNWTHIGIIYIDPDTNQSYVLETANYNDKSLPKGVIQVPLKVWQNLNSHYTVKYISNSKSVDSYQLKDIFDTYIGYKLYKVNSIFKWKRLFFPGPIKTKELTCTEFVASVFQQLNLLPKDIHISEYSAYDLMTICGKSEIKI